MTDQPNTPAGVTAGAGSATRAAPQLPGVTSHGPPGVFLGQHYTPWGALPVQTKSQDDAQAAYMAAFKTYHTTKSHQALVRLRDANHARFKA